MTKPKIAVLVGPTACGKTDTAVELAKKLDGEIISADSMQIYRQMTIGTAKPTEGEMQGIPHHLIDCVDPDEEYSVARFKEEALGRIEEILGFISMGLHCPGAFAKKIQMKRFENA